MVGVHCLIVTSDVKGAGATARRMAVRESSTWGAARARGEAARPSTSGDRLVGRTTAVKGIRVNLRSTSRGRAGEACGAARVPTATVLLAAAMLVAPGACVASAAAEPCSDVDVIFARGTFEPPGVGVTGQAFVDALQARLAPKTVEVTPVDYPASLDFANGAGAGVADASRQVTAAVARCPKTDIVLGGYSQGAAVSGYVTSDSVPTNFPLPEGITGPMPPEVARHVSAVVLFGTPSAGFLNFLVRDAPPIEVGHLYTAKTVELCAAEDPVCSPSGNDRGAHGAYASNGMTDQAADFTARAIQRSA